MERVLPKDRVSNRFCKADSDITFRSCDGILFKVHHRNLGAVSEGFAPPVGTSSQGEVVPLTEDGETLEILFQYMYPQRNPDLKDIDFKLLAKLAEAAEKYQAYIAMLICSVRMGEANHGHPFEVMMYAMRHGYPELMDKSEKVALEVSPTKAFQSFPPQIYIAWTRYYAQWLDMLASLHKSLGKITHPGGYGSPHIMHEDPQTKWFQWAISQLDRPASLLKLESLFQNLPPGTTLCNACKAHIKKWKNNELNQGIERMQRLSSFL